MKLMSELFQSRGDFIGIEFADIAEVQKNIKEIFFFLVRQMVSPLFTTKVAVRCRSSRLP